MNITEYAEFSTVDDSVLKKEFIDYMTEYKVLKDQIERLEHTIKNDEEDFMNLHITLYNTDLQFKINQLCKEFSEKARIDEQRKVLTDLYTKKTSMAQTIKSLLEIEGTHSLVCPICFERNVNSFIKVCGHTFCTACINSNKKPLCPMCREHYGFNDIKNLIYS